MTDELIIELKNKKSFVEELGRTIVKYSNHIKNIYYDIFLVNDELFEYLVYTYNDNSPFDLCVKECTGNSLSMILDEIAKHYTGGYYKENSRYKYLRSNAVLIWGLSVDTDRIIEAKNIDNIEGFVEALINNTKADLEEPKVDFVLIKLRAIWSAHPELRLGQLILNSIDSDGLYMIGDKTLIKKLEEFYAKFSEHKE